MNRELLGKYNLVLGLEVHLHVETKKKMFCRCSADIYNAEPNTHTCPTCLGLPGALPVPNADAIRKTQLLGLVFGSSLKENSRFDRKHYFYPDLPKGYQISQYKQPFCVGGEVTLSTGKKALLERIHLEEDTAKSIHEGGKTLIDFNMCSMPLIEIVTKPIFDDIDEAVEFTKYVQNVVRDYKIGSADMEKGQLRLEPNISLQTPEQKEKGELPKYKVEIKNINSFKFMEKAVLAEIVRQKALLDKSETPLQENRGFVEVKNETVSQRSKEDAHDYRYFPEPDIPPMVFDGKYFSKLNEEFESLKKSTPTYLKKLQLDTLNISEDFKQRSQDLLSTDDINKIIEIAKRFDDHKKLVNTFLNKKEMRELSPDQILKTFTQEKEKMSDLKELEAIVSTVLNHNKDAVESYKSGKENALQFLLGMVMRESKGKADATVTRNLLIERLKD